MIWLWRYLFGYLNITIYGENAERVLNAAAKNGVNIWNLRCKKGNIIGNIGIKNFIRLRQIKRGIKCKVKINKKIGFIFKTKKYINRFGIFTGIIVYFLILFFLSNFVWIINVNGNSNIHTSEILKTCKKIGIYEGAPKNKINTKYDAQRFLLHQKGVSWSALNIEGCVLTINLSEAEITDKAERQIPSNIKANIDGKIKKIDVTTGNVSVKVGDTVSKGDLLVSGVIENLASTHFVHSEGIIVAETKRVFSAEGKYLQNITQETKEHLKRYTLSIFNIKIPLYFGSIKTPHNYKKEIKNLKVFNKKIPIKIACENYNITEKINITYDKALLEEMLYREIKKQVEKFDFINCAQEESEVIYTDSGILLKVSYICEENIAVQDKILLDTVN